MSIDEHDPKIIHCRMLGHEVPFSYCRIAADTLPCRKIIDCWYGTIDVERFLKSHFTDEQIRAILAPPRPKITTIVDMIRQAQERSKGTQT